METSAKYRNVQRRPQVAITVDDVVGEGMDGVRLLEIRGRAETAVDETVADGHLSAHLIRVHPHRVLSWNIEPGHPGLSARTIS